MLHPHTLQLCSHVEGPDKSRSLILHNDPGHLSRACSVYTNNEWTVTFSVFMYVHVDKPGNRPFHSDLHAVPIPCLYHQLSLLGFALLFVSASPSWISRFYEYVHYCWLLHDLHLYYTTFSYSADVSLKFVSFHKILLSFILCACMHLRKHL